MLPAQPVRIFCEVPVCKGVDLSKISLTVIYYIIMRICTHNAENWIVWEKILGNEEQ